MPKKPRLRTLIGSQHFKDSKTLWKQMSSKNPVLVVSVILRLFFNILTPDEKYPLSVKANV